MSELVKFEWGATRIHTYVNGRKQPIVWEHTTDEVLADFIKAAEDGEFSRDKMLDLLKWMKSDKELASTLLSLQG